MYLPNSRELPSSKSKFTYLISYICYLRKNFALNIHHLLNRRYNYPLVSDDKDCLPSCIPKVNNYDIYQHCLHYIITTTKQSIKSWRATV